MRRSGITFRLLLPVLLALVILPPLSCLIFNQSAKLYAYREAEENLTALQEKIVPLMTSSFTDGTGARVSDQVRSFITRVSYLVSHESGNADLIILEDRLRTVFPRDEADKAAIEPLSAAVRRYIEASEEISSSGIVELSSEAGTRYLVCIYEVPVKSVQLRYLVTYCPSSRIGTWISDATLLVLLSSYLVAALVLAVVCLTVRSIRRPLSILGREAERIGRGSYEPIAEEFSVRELEELKVSMNRMAEEIRLSEAREKAFFQNVSHELRNPLMSISGYAQGIEQGIFPSDKEASHTILEESLRLTQMVNSLLTLSRLETGKECCTLHPVLLSEVIEDCLDRIAGVAVRRNIALCTDMPEVDASVLAEEELLEKVLDNLLSNAVRYAVSKVVIRLRSSQETYLISVCDDGPGIDDEDIPHIFERCYKGQGGVFGLGLAIARSAVQTLGGSISASNNGAGGAVFTLVLRKAV